MGLCPEPADVCGRLRGHGPHCPRLAGYLRKRKPTWGYIVRTDITEWCSLGWIGGSIPSGFPHVYEIRLERSKYERVRWSKWSVQVIGNGWTLQTGKRKGYSSLRSAKVAGVSAAMLLSNAMADGTI